MTDSPSVRPAVTVVVVGYNEKHLLEACFRSLRTIEYSPLRVIYVDNASTDDSLDWTRSHFPDVLAMSSGGNVGYCGGNNAGIRRALDDGADFVLILNPDTVVCNPGFMTVLVDYMTARPRVGKVGPKVWLRRYGEPQNTILGWPSILGSARSLVGSAILGPPPPKSAAVTEPTPVPSLNGCCLLVRSEALRDVGLYDDGFWCYMDEVDWDWQAERKGWQRHYVPVESIIHLQKVVGYDFASRANYYMKRNTALWYAKNGRWMSMIAWMGITLPIALLRALAAPFGGRSISRYLGFTGKLARAYASILADVVRGRLRGDRGASAAHPTAKA